MGEDEVVFKLILKDGCLRGEGYESVNFPAPAPALLVWPSGYQVSADGDRAQVKNAAGEVVAYSGAEVRFSGRFASGESDLGQKPAADNLGMCSGHHYLVGDEVSVISPEEALVFKESKTGLNFQRRESWRWEAAREFDPEYRRAHFSVEVKDNCLIASFAHEGEMSEYEIVWPAGFYPHVDEDRVEVRNGGGKTIVHPGERILMSGKSTSRKAPYGNSGCSERVLKIDRILDHGLPVTFLQHDADKIWDEVLWDGKYPNGRIYDDEFAKNHKRGKLEYDNGCMHIPFGILVWPKNFSMDESDGKFEILDENGQVVAREGEDVSLKVRPVSFSDEDGMRIIRNMPAGCDSTKFLFVGG